MESRDRTLAIDHTIHTGGHQLAARSSQKPDSRLKIRV
jgi:hypothetical protein